MALEKERIQWRGCTTEMYPDNIPENIGEILEIYWRNIGNIFGKISEKIIGGGLHPVAELPSEQLWTGTGIPIFGHNWTIWTPLGFSTHNLFGVCQENFNLKMI